MSRRKRWAVAILSIAALLVVGLLVVASRIPLSSDTLRRRLVTNLSERLESEVELATLSLHFSPRLHAVGTGLVVRYHGRQDVPPLFKIERFTVSASLSGLWRRRVDVVRLDGLDIQIPPDKNRGDDKDDNSEKPETRNAEPAVTKSDVEKNDKDDKKGADAPAEAGYAAQMRNYAKQIVISELQAPKASLTILRKDPNKAPRVWSLHSLDMQEVGRDTAMPFQSRLTNAVPPGEIDIKGEFGPWASSDPGLTPISGAFTFADANLGVFKGISGILSAKGELQGVLSRIEVEGQTDTPDFMVNISGHQVPLKTTYHAIVDGTNGNTTLDPVHATFLDTSVVAKGGVYEMKTGPGREVRLDVTIENGRLEDVMRLAVNTPAAPMRGQLDLVTALVIPPGKIDVVDKLQLDGRFAIDDGRFTNAEVQQKVTSLSQRARGQTAAPAGERVVSDFTGRFKLGNGQLALPEVTFDVPGAVVEIHGTYALREENLDFAGDLFMDAKISQTVTGFKSLLLKVVDPLFRKEGRTVVPLKIGGTRSAPQFGLDVGRVFGGGDDKPAPGAKTPPAAKSGKPAAVTPAAASKPATSKTAASAKASASNAAGKSAAPKPAQTTARPANTDKPAAVKPAAPAKPKASVPNKAASPSRSTAASGATPAAAANPVGAKQPASKVETVPTPTPR